MQDTQVITESRRGLLSIEQHFLQMFWTYNRSWHVLPFYGKTIDERWIHALEVATVGVIKEATVRKPILMG